VGAKICIFNEMQNGELTFREQFPGARYSVLGARCLADYFDKNIYRLRIAEINKFSFLPSLSAFSFKSWYIFSSFKDFVK
jgi:hypothetical protein